MRPGGGAPMPCTRIAAVAAVCLTFISFPASAQTGAFGFGWPYDGSNRQLDPSRFAWGATPAEACAQRTDDELLNGFVPTQTSPIAFVGYNGLVCGFQWLNQPNGPPGALIDHGDVIPQFSACSDIAFFPAQIPRPSWCLMQCPPDQKGTDGFCRAGSP